MTRNKFVAFIVLGFTFIEMASASNDEDLKEKKYKYFLHCQLTAADLMKDQGEFKGKSNTEQMSMINLACKFINEEMEKGKKWGLVKNPKFDGCSDAVRLLLPKGTSENVEKVNRAKYCAQYLNL